MSSLLRAAAATLILGLPRRCHRRVSTFEPPSARATFGTESRSWAFDNPLDLARVEILLVPGRQPGPFAEAAGATAWRKLKNLWSISRTGISR